jgi:hypothetical protein
MSSNKQYLKSLPVWPLKIPPGAIERHVCPSSGSFHWMFQRQSETASLSYITSFSAFSQRCWNSQPSLYHVFLCLQSALLKQPARPVSRLPLPSVSVAWTVSPPCITSSSEFSQRFLNSQPSLYHVFLCLQSALLEQPARPVSRPPLSSVSVAAAWRRSFILLCPPRGQYQVLLSQVTVPSPAQSQVTVPSPAVTSYSTKSCSHKLQYQVLLSQVTVPSPAVTSYSTKSCCHKLQYQVLLSLVTVPSPSQSQVTVPSPAVTSYSTKSCCYKLQYQVLLSQVTVPSPAQSQVTVPSPAQSQVTVPSPAVTSYSTKSCSVTSYSTKSCCHKLQYQVLLSQVTVPSPAVTSYSHTQCSLYPFS